MPRSQTDDDGAMKSLPVLTVADVSWCRRRLKAHRNNSVLAFFSFSNQLHGKVFIAH
jgi:hypothetical protein